MNINRSISAGRALKLTIYWLIQSMRTRMGSDIMRFIFGATILLLAGCSTYYTTLYAINDPPDPRKEFRKWIDWNGESVISDFHGWTFYIEVTGVNNEASKNSVDSNFFWVHIDATPEDSNMLYKDSIIIDQPRITLPNAQSAIPIRFYSQYKVNPFVCYVYSGTQIPVSEQSITLGFRVKLIKPDSTIYERESESTLRRYEFKKKSIPRFLIGFFGD
jgi:hypothetical protein